MSDLQLPTLHNFIAYIQQNFPDYEKFIDLMKNCNVNHDKKMLDINNAFTYSSHLKKYHKWKVEDHKQDLKAIEDLINKFLTAEVEDLAKIEDIKEDGRLTIEFNEFQLRNKIPEELGNPLKYAEIRDKILHEKDKYQQYVILKEYFLEKYIIHTHPSTDDIFIYNENDGIFTSDGYIFLKKEIQNIIPFWTRDARNEIIDKVRIDTYFTNGNPFNKQNIIVLENGVIEFDKLLKNNENYFSQFSADFLSTKKIPITYDPAIKLEKSEIDIFLSWATCGDKNFENYLLEAIADCFNNHYKSQIIHLFIGEGQNGKGTYLRLLSDFLGGPESGNITALGFGQIYENSFKLHALENAMANLNGDSSATFIRDPGTIKKASGEDIINADVKGEKKQRPFYNVAKMFSSSQHVPEAKDEDTEGWYRRFKISDWKAVLTDEMKAKSSNFEKNLRKPEELSYLLNRVLEAFLRLAKNNYVFSYAMRTSEEKRMDYLKKSSPIKLFIENFVMIKNNEVKFFKDSFINIFNFYNEQILKNRPMDKVTFWKKMKYEFEEIPVRQHKGKRYYDGLGFDAEKWNQLLKELHYDEHIGKFTADMDCDAYETPNNIEGYPFIDTLVYNIIQKYESEDLCYLDILGKLFYLKTEIVRDSLDRLANTGKIFEPRPNLFKITE